MAYLNIIEGDPLGYEIDPNQPDPYGDKGNSPITTEFQETINGEQANTSQESLGKPNFYIGALDSNYQNQFMKQNPNGIMRRLIASWADDPIHMNDRRGNINGKDFYATRNLARLADRFNNEFTFAGGDVGNFDSHGKVISTGGIQYEQNPQINTMEQRQYEDSRGIANKLRESDVGIVDTLNKAVPNAYATAQDRMVQYRDFIQRNEANLNKYLREMDMDIQYKKPWETFFQQVITQFQEKLPYELSFTAAEYLSKQPNHVWAQLLGSMWQPSLLTPEADQMLFGQFMANNYDSMRKAGLSDLDIMDIYNVTRFNLARIYSRRQNEAYWGGIRDAAGTAITGAGKAIKGQMPDMYSKHLPGPASKDFPGTGGGR